MIPPRRRTPATRRGPDRRPFRAGLAGPLPALLLAAGLLAGCAAEKANEAKPGGASGAGPAGRSAFQAPPVPVVIQVVESRDVKVTFTAVGSLEAREIIRVPARVSGVVQDIAFEEGKWAKPAQVLARIDPERYRLAAQRAEANWRQAEAAAREAEAALDKRKALREKDSGWVTEEELTNFSARLDQAQSAVAAARAAYDLARKDVQDSEVRAESPGLINQKLVDTGQYVTAGMPVATIVDSRRMKLSFTVAESEAVRLTDRAAVRFTVKALPGKEFTASLYHIGEAADPATRMVQCLAWVENPDRELRPGFFADVTVEVEDRKGSLVVPQTAVLPTDRGFVGFVAKGKDRVERRSLRLGLYTADGQVEVLEGLQPGDRVIVRGASILTDDSLIVPQAEPEAGAK